MQNNSIENPDFARTKQWTSQTKISGVGHLSSFIRVLFLCSERSCPRRQLYLLKGSMPIARMVDFSILFLGIYVFLCPSIELACVSSKLKYAISLHNEPNPPTSPALPFPQIKLKLSCHFCCPQTCPPGGRTYLKRYPTSSGNSKLWSAQKTAAEFSSCWNDTSSRICLALLQSPGCLRPRLLATWWNAICCTAPLLVRPSCQPFRSWRCWKCCVCACRTRIQALWGVPCLTSYSASQAQRTRTLRWVGKYFWKLEAWSD